MRRFTIGYATLATMACMAVPLCPAFLCSDAIEIRVAGLGAAGLVGQAVVRVFGRLIMRG
jgi:hypothetical protein